MEPKVIKQEDVPIQDFGIIKVRELLNSIDLESMSVAIVELNGENRTIKHMVSDSAYFVLKGSGRFALNDKLHEVTEGDLIVIPKGVTYYDEGEMTLLAFNSPRFNIENVESIGE